MMNKSEEIINTSEGDLMIVPNGRTCIVAPSIGNTYSLKDLQDMVNGFVEFIHSYKTNEVLVVNEEGMLKGLPINKKATEWFRANDAFGKGFIYGNALLTTNDKL